MRIAFTTTFDATDVHNWSGTPYHMAQALEKAGNTIEYVGNLKRALPPFFKLKQIWGKYACDQRLSPRFNITAAKYYSEQAAKALAKMEVDAIVSPLINPIAYLDTDKPIILWTDALYASLVGFYPPFNYHSADTIRQGNEITRECLSRLSLAIFSSDWAARSAIELYGMDESKVKVVPFGANIKEHPSFSEIQPIIKHRDKNKIRLLFLAKSWERKGGDKVVATAKALHDAGHDVELTIVGYDNVPGMRKIPPYVRCAGYISKNSPEGTKQLKDIFNQTHFLFVPSTAEAYGIVFCEANAYGIPCISNHIGGIRTIIKDDTNGRLFAANATPGDYAEYILSVTSQSGRYQELALSSYCEYTSRLNWDSAVREVMSLIGAKEKTAQQVELA